MLRVDTLQDLLLAAETLARFGANRDEALTVITNGGGAGVMAADAAALRGVKLPDPSVEFSFSCYWCHLMLLPACQRKPMILLRFSAD